MANFTAGTSFSDGVTNDVTAAKLNALVADAVPTSNLSLNSTTGTIATLNSTTGTIATLNSTTGTIASLNSTTGTIATLNSTTGTIATLNSTTGTITTGVIPTLTSTTLITTGTGTAAAPAIVPTGDTNTGIFFPAADTIAFSEGGAEAMRINSSGNVGIGISSPTYSLHVYNSANSGKLINIANPNSGTGAYAGVDALSDSVSLSVRPYGSTFNTFAHAGIALAGAAEIWADTISGSGPQALLIGIKTAKPLIFATSETERLRIDSSGNVIISGNKSLISNGAGGISSNTSIGSSALASNTTGYYNTASGLQALNSNTTGYSNTASGVNALLSNTTGANNTASGVSALNSNTTGYSNTASGVSALYSNTTGYSNTASGFQAGYGTGTDSNTSGSNNTFIGNESVGASATANNVVTLGNGSIATLRCQVTSITALSDLRDKKDIQPLSAGLDFIGKLRPVSFVWNTRDKAKVNIPDAGFIAQELLDVQEVTGITIPNLVSQENPERLEAAYGTLIPVLVQAIKELKAKVESLEEKNK